MTKKPLFTRIELWVDCSVPEAENWLEYQLGEGGLASFLDKAKINGKEQVWKNTTLGWVTNDN